ncbi:unnamed protein product [Linum tenue]|nr:unnamed protein product [Linum tenue]
MVLKACSSPDAIHVGKTLHSHVTHLGFQADVYVQTSLLDMYSKCGDLVSSRKVFDDMSERGVVSWNSMIAAYCRCSLVDEAVSVVNQMRALGLEPSSTTFLVLFPACSSLLQGLSTQCCAFKMGFLNGDDEVPLTNSVMGMLVKHCQTHEARAILEKMQEPSVISWTTVTSGYVETGHVKEAFSVFNQMRRKTISLDYVAFFAIISACGQHGDLLVASTVHSLTIKTGCEGEDAIDNLLVSMYAKCCDLVSARRVFDSSCEKTVFVWTSMISAYQNAGRPADAIELFKRLLQTSVKPDEATLAIILSACADTGTLSLGEEIEEYITTNGLQLDRQVQTSLIHMFCKCGSIEKARTVFDSISEKKDLAAWSSMINGYAIHGMGNEALSLFHDMQNTEGIVPDSLTYTSILLACSHSGLVEDGLKYFKSMQKDFGLEPRIEHYTCLVDLLGRAGRLDLALETTLDFPEKIQGRMWAPFLSACKKHRNDELGELAARKLLEFSTGSTGNYVLMANLYTSQGKWKEAAETRRLMDDRGLAKEPGWSQVEICDSGDR